jgi:hypothetical protein
MNLAPGETVEFSSVKGENHRTDLGNVPYEQRHVLFEEKIRPEEGLDASLAQYRALLRVAQAYRVYRVQNKTLEVEGPDRGIERRLDPLSADVATPASFMDAKEGLKTAAHQIRGVNVITTELSPPIHVPIADPIPGRPPEWLDKLYSDLDEHFNLGGEATKAFKGAFLSGSNMGMLKSMQQMINKDIGVKVPAKHISTALIRLLARQGYDPDQRIVPDELNPFCLARARLPFEKKAGIDDGLFEHDRDANYDIKYGSHSFTKEAAFDVAILELHSMWLRIEDHIRRNVPFPADEFKLFLYKLARKIEVRGEKDRPKPGEPEKTRTFLIPPALKILLDKMVSSPFFYWSRGRDSNGIGTNWHHGGGQEFAKKMHACGCRMNHKWWDWDCSKFDHSLKAPVLTIMSFLSMLAFKRDGSYESYRRYIITNLMLSVSASNSTVHVCSWLGEWRTIIGELFSGEYNTSNWNTWYHSLIVECYKIWEAEGADQDVPAPACPMTSSGQPGPVPADYVSELENGPDLKRRVSQINSDCTMFVVQGDDGVMCVPYDSLMSIVRFRYYAKKYWDVIIKPGGPSEENNYFFTDADINTGHIKIPGCAFLQRRFIKCTRLGYPPAVMPFRPVEDYWVRMGMAANVPLSDGSALDELDIMAYYRMRWVGLLYDTMETNIAASNQLRFLIDQLDKKEPNVVNRVIHILQSENDLPTWVSSIVDYALKMGPDALDIPWAVAPPRGQILNRFWPDEIILEQRRHYQDTKTFLPQSLLAGL